MSASETGETEFKLGYRPALDGLRGFGMIIVLSFHVWSILLERPYTPVPTGTFIGVDIFFTMSGFLITTLLIEEYRRRGRISLKFFYIRRLLRLAPALLTFLVAISIYAVLAGDSLRALARTIVYSLTYTFNWFANSGKIAETSGHLWSLAVEEQFYIVWPTVVIVALRVVKRFPAVIPAGLFIGIVAGTYLRFFHFDKSGLWSDAYYRTDARVDQILWGVVLAVVIAAGLVKVKPRPVLALAGAAVLIAGCFVLSPFERFYYMGGSTLVSLATLAVMFGCFEGDHLVSRVVSIRLFTHLGKISYALYLFHVLVFVAMHNWGSSIPRAIQIPLALAISYGLAIASWRFMETKALAQRHRFDPEITRPDPGIEPRGAVA